MNGRLEENLAASCGKIDASAYEGLVKAYSRRIFAVCLGMLGNRHDAEDIAQQAFLRGLTDIGRLRDSEQFGAWICRIAKNLCIDFIRRQKLKQGVLLQKSPAGTVSSKDYPELQNALAKLPEDYRIALMLYYFDGRSTQRIADVLGISQDAVHARLSRARKQLRKLLEAQGET